MVAVWTFKQMPQGHKNIIETAQGLDQRQITLPDGSTVWLRRDATLTYSDDMFKSTERRVNIQGEAYFEVVHDQTKPFRVEIGDRASVEVLGTSFDVKTVDQASDITVILKSGKVRFKTAPTEDGVIMAPNQKLTYKTAESKIKLTNVYSNADIAWQAGGLSFINAPLSQVKSEIEQFYGIQITISNQEMLDCKFTSPIPSKSAEGLLKTIAAFYNMKIINTGENNYELKGGVCSK
jgi:transmembrane sensor